MNKKSVCWAIEISCTVIAARPPVKYRSAAAPRKPQRLNARSACQMREADVCERLNSLRCLAASESAGGCQEDPATGLATIETNSGSVFLD